LLLHREAPAENALRLDEDQRHATLARRDRVPLIRAHDEHTSSVAAPERPADRTGDANPSLERHHDLE
jgi:hypothetical protein